MGAMLGCIKHEEGLSRLAVGVRVDLNLKYLNLNRPFFEITSKFH